MAIAFFYMICVNSLVIVSCFQQALIDTTDHEIFTSLTSVYNDKYEKAVGCVGTQILGERAKIILNEVRDLKLFTRIQCLEYIGNPSLLLLLVIIHNSKSTLIMMHKLTSLFSF